MILRERAQALNWSVVYRDIEPFIIDANNQPDFNKERLLELLNVAL